MKKLLLASLAAIALALGVVALPVAAVEGEATDAPVATSLDDAALTDGGTGDEQSTDPSDPDATTKCDTEEEKCQDEEEGEPEMWPAYIALGALGVTIILIIVINLASKKK